jgi:hypothetical protein
MVKLPRPSGCGTGVALQRAAAAGAQAQEVIHPPPATAAYVYRPATVGAQKRFCSPAGALRAFVGLPVPIATRRCSR